MAVYLANGRTIGSGDTVPNTLLAAGIADGEGLTLDRYRPMVAPGPAIPYWAAERYGRLVSVYPIAPAVMAAPFMWMQMQALDVLRPGWRSRGFVATLFVLGKNVAALFAALAAVVLFVVLGRSFSNDVVWPTILAAALGSEMWVVASQTLWPHGPSALALAVAIALALEPDAGPRRLVAAGVMGGIVAACRLPSAIYVVPLVAWLATTSRTKAGWFVAGALPPLVLAIAYNVAWFGTWQGGIALLEAQKPVTHAVESAWTSAVLAGAAGTLVSPSRGLFVYCPWIGLAVLALPFYWRRLGRHTAVAMLVASLVPSLLVLSAYATWWGGASFGPRFWTDATPIFALLLAACLEWIVERAPAWRIVPYGAIAVAVGIQAVGAACYPSSWNGYPTSIDLDHARLWDWRDSEIVRCLREGPHPGAFEPSSQGALDSVFGLSRQPTPAP
jgi:hypothetical protein